MYSPQHVKPLKYAIRMCLVAFCGQQLHHSELLL